MSSAQIKLRRDTAANWTAANPVLADGEFGFERDTGKSKVGNGSTAWATLPYHGKAMMDEHLADADPHPQYLTPAEGNAAYTPLAHASNTSNPHSVTKAQVGLGSVDNTSDANKPVSTAQQAALDLKATSASLGTMSTQNANAVAITGGAIDGTPIGNTTRSTGKFTTLDATGALTTAGIHEDGAGNVGIGTASPISLGLGTRGITANGTNGGFYNLRYAEENIGYLNAESSALSVNTFTGKSLKLGTEGVSRAIIDLAGNFIAGATAAGVTDSNSCSFNTAGNAYAVVNHVTGTATTTYYSVFGYGGSVIGSITQSGTTAVAYNTTSDHRLKNNIRPANADRFEDVEFVDFEWIDGRHDCGVIAHQLQAIYPDLVVGEKDGTEIRSIEISPAIPAVYSDERLMEAVYNDDGEEIEPAIYEMLSPAVEAVFEDQVFDKHQQVNYLGLIPRMGVHVQKLMKQVDEQQAQLVSQRNIIESLSFRLEALEAA